MVPAPYSIQASTFEIKLRAKLNVAGIGVAVGGRGVDVGVGVAVAGKGVGVSVAGNGVGVAVGQSDPLVNVPFPLVTVHAVPALE